MDIINSHEVIFALDIGTRTVTGILGHKDGECFKIIKSYTTEHQGRSMYDGQIHHIDKVAKTVIEVKEYLEKSSGFTISRVAIAAAGRALKTIKLRIDRENDNSVEIAKETVESLELEAIQKAQGILEEKLEGDLNSYYCVGYSVVNYYLNDGIIGELTGHKGKLIGVEILATFLPHIVVDSLYTVMNRVNLEVVNMTLEPIAAINVSIHQGLRLLNLAMVDIGAGTSDIAITKDGSIIAYAMVPMAGDEITEEISRRYLLDFDCAERVKIQLSAHEQVRFTDILGIEHQMESSVILEEISCKIRELAKEISDKIIEYNQKAPSAVFLVGGGSQIPGLAQGISEFLGLQKERVAVRGTEILKNVDISQVDIKGPEYITPLGIGYTAMITRGDDFLKIKINGQTIRLFNSKRITVADALILISYDSDKMIGRRGKDLVYELNGEIKTIKGQMGQSAQIFVNMKPGSIHTKLEDGDEVIIEPAVKGNTPKLTIFQLMDEVGYVSIDGSRIALGVNVLVNGNGLDDGYLIKLGDKVEYEKLSNLGQLVDFYKIRVEDKEIFLRDKKIGLDYIVNCGDSIILKGTSQSFNQIAVDREEKGIEVTANGQRIIIEEQKPIFVDVFKYINFDISKPQGIVVLMLNGRSANYMDEIKNGDEIEIYWQNP